MYNYKTITSVELELTSRCNAACPQCARNNNGGTTVSTLPLDTWTIENIKKAFVPDFVKQLKQFYLCGTYGDPMIAKDVIPTIKYLKSINPNMRIGAHTNASLRTTKFFTELAGVIDFLGFGIDGLEDTNHLYRRKCNWKKIINNAKAFIDAGGVAEWDFIVFEHNQHQVKQAEELSKRLGFAKFNVKKTGRFMDYDHTYSPSLEVKDTNDNVEYTIDVPTDPAYINSAYKVIESKDVVEYKHKTCIKCNSQKNQHIYIGADANVYICGWLHDRMYPDKTLGSYDNITILNKVKTMPANCLQNTLEEIVDGEWFKFVQDSWTNNDRLERCAVKCGTDFNLVGSQNANMVSFIDNQIVEKG